MDRDLLLKEHQFRHKNFLMVIRLHEDNHAYISMIRQIDHHSLKKIDDQNMNDQQRLLLSLKDHQIRYYKLYMAMDQVTDIRKYYQGERPLSLLLKEHQSNQDGQPTIHL